MWEFILYYSIVIKLFVEQAKTNLQREKSNGWFQGTGVEENTKEYKATFWNNGHILYICQNKSQNYWIIYFKYVYFVVKIYTHVYIYIDKNIHKT